MVNVENKEGAGIIQQMQNTIGSIPALLGQAYANLKQGIANELSGEVAEVKEEYKEFQSEMVKARAVGFTNIFASAALQLAGIVLLILVIQHYRRRYGWLVGASTSTEEVNKEGYATVDDKEAILPTHEYPKEKL